MPSTIAVVDANGATQTVNTLPGLGQQTKVGSLPVTIASDQVVNTSISSLPALAAGTNTIGNVGLNAGTNLIGSTGGVYNTSPPTLTNGQTSTTQLDVNGNLKVNIAAGSASSAVTQGSTTSGQSGGLSQAAVTSVPPTYTNGQTNPLTLTTSGSLRVDATATTQPISSTQLPSSLGTQVTTASMAVNVASDQTTIPANTSTSAIIAQPAANTIAALNGTVQYQVQGGSTYLISLTNPAATTSQFVGTVTFQYSLNGSVWSSLNAMPLNSPVAQAVTTSTAVGLWQVQAPAGATVYIRASMTAYTSGTVVVDLINASQNSGMISLPWTYSVTSNNTLMGPINTSGFSEFVVQVSAITTTVLTVQGSNDPSLTTWDTLQGFLIYPGSVPSSTIGSSGTYRYSTAGFKFVRVQVTTTGTVLTIQGIAGRLGTPSSVIGNNISLGSNIVYISGSSPATAAANGSSNRLLGVTQGSSISQVDVNAGAFAGAGSVLGTVIGSTQGGGAVIAAEINVSTLTLGTASAVFAILQESTGGTNFSDIWISDPITSTGIFRVPATSVAGRRRWRFFSVGGTSTTVTATITTLELPSGGNYPLARQMRDSYSATNPLALIYNSSALAASTFVLGTVTSVTTPMYIENTKQLTAFMVLTGSPVVITQPVVTLQLSMDGTNFWSVTSATMTAAGNGTYAIPSQTVGGAKFARLIVSTAASYTSGSYTISNMGVNTVN